MKIYIIQLLAICTFSFFIMSCGNGKKDYIQENKAGNFEDVIGFIDDADAEEQAILTFDEPIHEYGILKQGDVYEHDYTFTNTGNKDLYILDTTTSCGCTVGSYSEEAIKPGKSGKISVKFDTKGKSKEQEKQIKVYSNTFVNETVLTLSGFVKTKK